MEIDLNITWVFSVIAAIMLFLHGLAAFSDELTRLGGERLRDWIRRITRSDLRGAIAGTVATGLVQSSSAVTSIAIGLFHNKTLMARSAFAIMIGANVGSTLTAWLVAFKIAGLGPMFISLGGLWSLLGPRALKSYGKPLFYFGLIFLALDLISYALTPLSGHKSLGEWQATLDIPAYALLAGALLTAAVQSSSVVSGLAVISVTQGIITPHLAVWMVAGANIGTTSTALVAGTSMDRYAIRLGLTNTLFNVFGVVLFATVLQPAVSLILNSDLSPSQQVAMVHTVFNLAAAALALIILPLVWPRIEHWISLPQALDSTK